MFGEPVSDSLKDLPIFLNELLKQKLWSCFKFSNSFLETWKWGQTNEINKKKKVSIQIMLQFVSHTYYPIALKSGFSYTGDAPACQHEVGHQKGGHFFCWSCPLKAHRSNDIAHVFNLDYISIKKHKEIALDSTQS